ncbi:MAG: alanine--tRNA ligase [Bacillota bacterium]
MTGKEIRERYLKYFEGKGHRRLPSASLIPANDPSILWTAAGMVPFKPYFTGAAKPGTPRVTTCQKCIRTPDIDSVGRTARHHTFFEMLGNFSFGDYFKQEAIGWAWEFVTRDLGLPPEKLWITIYLDDDEAFDIWRREEGLPAGRIIRLDKDTNFWEIGVGPCGPCSEIYVDLGEGRGCGSPECAVGCDCDRYLEIWNLVFIQFFKDEEGNYTPLESKGIDTGMGLERVASVLQGVKTNFDTDLFREIMDFTARLIGREYGQDEKTDLALKVIADHCRAVTFAVSDGALPSNEGRGYVIRRLLRRAVRYGRLTGREEPFLYLVAGAVINQMSDAYPELQKNSRHIMRVVRTEEERFGETLAQGTEILNRLIREAEARGLKTIAGEDAFKLYDTYGFPLELTGEIADEHGLKVDGPGFDQAMEEQRRRARDARQNTEYISEQGVLYKNLRDDFGETRFVGYGQLEAEARVLAILSDGARVERAEAGREVELILDVTPCCAEAGGQVSDLAAVTAPGAEVLINSVSRPVEGLWAHRGRVKAGLLAEGDMVQVKVEPGRRLDICRNHSATHLLHKALREVLGDHVKQAGSLVEPGRLRFDFTHYTAVTPEELRQVEQVVNRAVLAALRVETMETGLEEARDMGAAALFGEKYGDRVRVVKMDDYSLELCGGTHVRSTAEIGLFKLLGESGIGAGLRRIEALTGEGALKHIEEQEEILNLLGKMLKVAAGEAPGRVEHIVAAHKELEHENEALRARLARYEVQSLLDQVKNVDGVNVLAASSTVQDMDSLRAMVDLLRDRLVSGVIFLGSAGNGRVNLVAAVTKDLLPRGLHAGKMVKEIAPLVGGGGGGRPDMAQAGGKNPAMLQEALHKVYDVVGRQLK